MRVAHAGVLLLLLSITMPFPTSDAQTLTSKKAPAKDMHGLIIYGDGFAFLANEPKDWDVDTGQEARNYRVNAIFFPRAQESRVHRVNIRVRLNQKTTEDPNEDMAADVEGYKDQYPATKFADLQLTHPDYRSSAKLFYTENDFYEYVVYLNPGQQSRFMFSVSMSKEKQPATQEELAALAHVLQSLQFVTADTHVKRPE